MSETAPLVLLNRAIDQLGDDSPTEEMARQLAHSAAWVLEHAKSLDDAKSIHDHLRRAQLQFEQHKASMYATNLLVAQRIRTEWNIGKTLAELPRENGGRGNVSHDGNSFLVAIQRAGIDKSKAYRWQDLAKIDPQDLELYFEEQQRRGEELSTSGVLNYFTSHVTVDMDAPDLPDDDEIPEPPEMNDELPQIRTVTIVCRHCGVKDAYEVA